MPWLSQWALGSSRAICWAAPLTALAGRVRCDQHSSASCSPPFQIYILDAGMTEIYSLATLWLGLALMATLLSIWLRIATAMSEIIVGTVAQLIIGAVLGAAALGTDQSWIKFLASTGAVVLTFLAGAEVDPRVMRRLWTPATLVGLVGFEAPYLGRGAVARFRVGWGSDGWWPGGAGPST